MAAAAIAAAAHPRVLTADSGRPSLSSSRPGLAAAVAAAAAHPCVLTADSGRPSLSSSRPGSSSGSCSSNSSSPCVYCRLGQAQLVEQQAPACRLLIKDVGHGLHQHAATTQLQGRQAGRGAQVMGCTSTPLPPSCRAGRQAGEHRSWAAPARRYHPAAGQAGVQRAGQGEVGGAGRPVMSM